MQIVIEPFVDQFERFPASRYMGSKNKLIVDIWQELRKIEFESFFDAFAGSNVVGYFLKCQGKRVITNDFMTFSFFNSKAIIENSSERISKEDIKFLLKPNRNNGFIKKTFKNIFFSDEENIFLDRVRKNIS